jgi:hypothetical protein
MHPYLNVEGKPFSSRPVYIERPANLVDRLLEIEISSTDVDTQKPQTFNTSWYARM